MDLGVLNCYATVISHIKSLFDSIYATRICEMLLGKKHTNMGNER